MENCHPLAIADDKTLYMRIRLKDKNKGLWFILVQGFKD